MQKDEKKLDSKGLVESHLIEKDKEFVKAYKQNPPQVAEKLQWQPGEQIVSELDEKDLIQLLSRYLNNDGVYVKNILHLLLRIEKELSWLLERFGVDINAKFKEDAKLQAELIEKRLAESKEALKNVARK